jgi:hypothetical protein
VAAAVPIDLLAVVSASAGVVLAALLVGVVLVTAAVLWVVFRLMADPTEDEPPASPGPG